ncbi:MAG: ECF transporter S component [Christensenella sp.]|nr:ECF transporter S component [Christensenella sp.]
MNEERRIKLGKKEKNMSPKRRFLGRTVLSFFIIMVAIPLTIWFGWKYGDRSYYITSLLIIAYLMIPFFLVFEKRKPQAREIVVLAVMCAIAVASRTAFIWLPHFKPMTAIIMITGIAFGAEAGFLAGAVSGFVSNFLFGQGPWTPWQMFAFGIAGFLAGLLYQKGLLKKDRLPLCVFGGVLVMTVIGPLLDTCALFTMSSVVTVQSAAAIYLSGIPVNAVHAAATVFTLLLFSRPLFEKLDRIQVKYGMMEA